MARMRSPSYPSISLEEAIGLVRKVHEKSRTNMIDREAAAKDMGYTGLTGRSLTVLSGLIQFGLLEKAGKGGVRVTRLTVDILHGLTDEIKKSALMKAGTAPALYQDIFDRFPDGEPPENALRSYLIQREFGDVAIGPAVSSFLETYRMLEEAKVFGNHGSAPERNVESEVRQGEADGSPLPPPPPPGGHHGGYQVIEGERVVFSEEIGTHNYLKLVAKGEMNSDLLDALEDFIRRQKKRIEFQKGLLN